MQLGQALEFCPRGLRPLQGVRDLDDPEMPQALREPWPVGEFLAGDQCGIALCETGRRRDDALEIRAVLGDERHERGIAAGRLGQLVDIGLQLIQVTGGIKVEDADGNLGLQCIGSTAGTSPGTRPAMPDSGCRVTVWGVTHSTLART